MSAPSPAVGDKNNSCIAVFQASPVVYLRAFGDDGTVGRCVVVQYVFTDASQGQRHLQRRKRPPLAAVLDLLQSRKDRERERKGEQYLTEIT